VSGGPDEVEINLYVISVSSLSDVDMDFTMDIYFRQFWKDSRLAFEKKPGFETIKLGHEFGKMIWVPDTFFVNEKESFIHTVTTKNEFIRVEHTGEVKRSVR
jgi:gamma-aminobutyric acid receptor subunit beta